VTLPDFEIERVETVYSVHDKNRGKKAGELIHHRAVQAVGLGGLTIRTKAGSESEDPAVPSQR